MRFALPIILALVATVDSVRVSTPALHSRHVSAPAVSRRALFAAPVAIARLSPLASAPLAIGLPVSAAPYQPYTPSKPDAAAAAAEKKRREAAWAASKTGWKPGFAVEYSSSGTRPGAPPK